MAVTLTPPQADKSRIPLLEHEITARLRGGFAVVVSSASRDQGFRRPGLPRDLLRAVAGDGDVPIARVHDLASVVIQTPAFQLAQEILKAVRESCSRRSGQSEW